MAGDGHGAKSVAFSIGITVRDNFSNCSSDVIPPAGKAGHIDPGASLIAYILPGVSGCHSNRRYRCSPEADHRGWQKMHTRTLSAVCNLVSLGDKSGVLSHRSHPCHDPLAIRRDAYQADHRFSKQLTAIAAVRL